MSRHCRTLPQPENVLFESDAPRAPLRVADFGAARRLVGGGGARTLVGTVEYVAPEVLRASGGYGGGGQAYSHAVDVWRCWID